MRIALAQINTTVGDFAGNETKIQAAYRRAEAQGAELLVLPELATTGYPPRDLLLRPEFIQANEESLRRIAGATGATGLLLGFVGRSPGRPGREIANAAALCHQGRVVATRAKTLLPTYDVFDEDRYFEPSTANAPIEFNGVRLGVTICEDIWNDGDFWRERRYRRDPAAELAAAGASVLVNLSASPWHLGKDLTRLEMLRSLARKTRLPVVYCNLVGGNDELVFDGGSLVLNSEGQPLARGAAFAEDHLLVDLTAAPAVAPAPSVPESMLHDALVLGLRDYLRKCDFRSVVLGLSGGIDSAVCACLAVAALGPDHVHGVSLPSPYSSPGSLEDARALATALRIRNDVIPIGPAFEQLKEQLRDVFAGRPEDVTEENLQARLRGVLLMALSNKNGSLLLTTGNKSEVAVGYCTLYGDMCGGLAVISDVPKTMVYSLARWINRHAIVIPESTLAKPPSAELRPGQTDQDSLPPYEVLDAILDAYVVEGRTADEILRLGIPGQTVRQVLRLIDRSEYKRRQAAPGLKVTSKAFGMGRRVPIAQRFHF
jgi:NAD+ synthase (glutamine-hydrolysing)